MSLFEQVLFGAVVLVGVLLLIGLVWHAIDCERHPERDRGPWDC